MHKKTVLLITIVLLISVLGSSMAFANNGPVIWGETIMVNDSPQWMNNWSGTGTYGSQYPRMTRLANTDLLCVYTISDNAGYREDPNGGLKLEAAKSTDNGKTWQAIATIADPGRDLDNGNFVQLSNGDLLLACRSVRWHESYSIKIYKSTDNGSSWIFLSTVDSNEGTPGSLGNPDKGMYEPHLQLLDNGNVAVFYANEKHVTENPAYSQIISERVSSDQGISWDNEIFVAWDPKEPSLRPGMPITLKMTNGQYICLYEVGGGAYGYAICYKISSDGVTWISGVGTTIPEVVGCPAVCSMPDGRLFLTGNNHVLLGSNNFGETWFTNPDAPWGASTEYGNWWPAVYQTGINEIGVITSTGRWYGGNNIQIKYGRLPMGFHTTNFEWPRFGGTWTVTDGVYTVTSSNADKSHNVSFNPAFKDFVIESDIKINNSGQGSILFNVNNAGVGADNFLGYGAGIDTAGMVWLGKFNNNYTELGSNVMTITPGVTYHMKISVNNGNIKVYIDDVLKIDVDDMTWTYGNVGVRGGFSNSVSFSNFYVYQSRYTNDFNNNKSEGWIPYGGTWSLTEGEYNLTASTNEKSVFAWAKALVNNYTLEGDVKVNNAGQSGLLFNVSNPSTGANNFDGYGAGIDTAGNVWLGKWNGTSYTSLGTTPMTISAGTSYRVKVVNTYGAIQVYVNNVLRISVTDTTYKMGNIGVRGGTGGCSSTFDNISFSMN